MVKTFETSSPIILILGMQFWGLKLYKSYINDDPGLILTYFMARSNLVAHVPTKTVTKSFNGKTLRVMTNLTKINIYEKMYDHYFQTSFSLKWHGQIKAKFHVEPPFKGGNEILYE